MPGADTLAFLAAGAVAFVVAFLLHRGARRILADSQAVLDEATRVFERCEHVLSETSTLFETAFDDFVAPARGEEEPAMSNMTPGDRRDLRSVVKTRMRVLRAEVKRRQTELEAEAEARLVERYAGQDRLVADVRNRIADDVRDAQAQVAQLVSEVAGENEGFGLYACENQVRAPRVGFQREDRAQLHRALLAGIKEQVADALLALDKQEADLLQSLAVDGLETDATRAFLAMIPTVAELVPSRRLREIEAIWDESKGAKP